VSPGDRDLAGETEIVANEHARPHDQRRGETFVVAVPQTQHQTVIAVLLAVDDLEQSEVTMLIGGQSVGLVDNFESDPGKRIFNLLEQSMVTDRNPRLCPGRRLALADLLAIGFPGAAMKRQI